MGTLQYSVLLLTPLGRIRVLGGVAFLFLFLGGGEANMSGSIGPKSVSGGSLSKGDGGSVISVWIQYPSKYLLLGMDGEVW